MLTPQQRHASFESKDSGIADRHDVLILTAPRQVLLAHKLRVVGLWAWGPGRQGGIADHPTQTEHRVARMKIAVCVLCTD